MYSVLPSKWQHSQEVPMISWAWDYLNVLMNSFFVPSLITMQKYNPPFALQEAVHEQTTLSSTSLGFNLYDTQFPCFYFTPMTSRLFEIARWVSPYDSTNSCWIWHVSWPSSASNFISILENLLSFTTILVSKSKNTIETILSTFFYQ